MRRTADGETSATIAERVARAASVQQERQGKANQHLTTHEIDRLCKLDSDAEQWLCETIARMHWSARGLHRVLRVARTIADLSGDVDLNKEHIGEAIQCRRVLRSSP
ncbi:MAG: hypothetical protein Q7T25_05730 [Sideroxyarcus sp.]|nr:hypothetical protein [Sideroxyarcus sp.]